MKRTMLLAALITLPWLPTPAPAQDKKAADKPAAAPAKPAEKPAAAAVVPVAKPVQPPAPAPAAKPAEKPAEAAQVASAAPRRSRAHVDARECLKHDTNRAIMVCAEKFR